MKKTFKKPIVTSIASRAKPLSESRQGSDRWLINSDFRNNDVGKMRDHLASQSSDSRKRRLNLRDIHGDTLLHKACGMGNLSMVELLLEQKEVSLNIKDRFGRDPLDLAIEVGHPGIIKILFAKRAADIDFDSDDAQKPENPRIRKRLPRTSRPD